MRDMSRVNSKSKLITIRLPHEMQAELRRLGEEQDRSWQAILKEILADGLGLNQGSSIETNVYPAPHLFRAVRRIQSSLERRL